jgi:elongation factor 2
VVNLVDTPGHIDFSGKVTRAMRAIDGAIVVIDAVEGVMAQTESVIRQAIKERVQPVLFINKIDRLIRELKLSEKQIQDRLTEIIQETNRVIESAFESQSDLDWTVSTQANTVAFGSALHKWAFTVVQMKENNLHFKDIINNYQKEKVENLSTLLPIHKPILTMILDRLPSPKKAQSYRAQHIWKGDLQSPAGAALLGCKPESPLVIGITKIVTKSKHGLVAVGRIFSGTIKKGSQIRVFPSDQLHKTQRITLFMGSRQVVIPSMSAGNICGVIGLEEVQAGDTITGQHIPEGMVPFEEIEYASEPVVTIAIEPKRPRELPRLISNLETITKGDPNLVFSINEQTGENLLSGLGLLHLEIALKDIETLGVQVDASDPIVLYRETPRTYSKLPEMHQSPNGHNEIRLEIHPQDAEIMENNILHKDERNNSLKLHPTIAIPESVEESMIAGFIWALERGPLCLEPVSLTQIKITEVKISDNLVERGRVELMSMIKEAIFKAFELASMTLLEPIYTIQVVVTNEYLKSITGVIIAKRGKVERVDHKGALITMTGLLPVSESFDLADILRSKSSGKAIWQTKFSHWQVVPDQRAKNIISDIRRRRGLR